MSILEPPKNAQLMDTKTGTSWFDENGILYSISKKSGPLSMEETMKITEDFKKMLNGKKVCMLVDVTNSNETDRETREYAAQEFPKITKAIAMVSKSALGKMLANLFFTIKEQPFPTKMFNTEAEAKERLKQYL